MTKTAGANGPDYNNLRFHHDKADPNDYGLVHGEITAHHPDHGPVGKLRYTHDEFEPMVGIKGLDTHPDHTRRGIASQLMSQLEKHYPDTPIDHGGRSPEGKAWAEKFYGPHQHDESGGTQRTTAPTLNGKYVMAGLTLEDFRKQAMPWHPDKNLPDHVAKPRDVKSAGFKSYVGRGDEDEFEDESHHGGFDEDAWEKTEPEPTHEEQKHYDEHDEYPDSHHERHEQAYAEHMDKKAKEDEPDRIDPELHHFIGEHSTDADVWHKHGTHGPVDISKGVHATQSHVAQFHIDRYHHAPEDEAWHMQHGGRHNGYLANEHPLLVTHHGELHAIDGHHRVAAALQRGDKHIVAHHMNLDEHPHLGRYHDEDNDFNPVHSSIHRREVVRKHLASLDKVGNVTERVAVLVREAVADEWIKYDLPSMIRIAHVSGNQVDIMHCPFCGSGSLVARSDGTCECGFCTAVFTVQVQPQYSAFPQTVEGQPYPWPGRPNENGQVSPDLPGGDDQLGGDPIEGGMEDEGGDDFGEEAEDEGNDDDGDVPDFLKKSYLTAKGARLDVDKYIDHLAIAHAKNRMKVISSIRSSH